MQKELHLIDALTFTVDPTSGNRISQWRGHPVHVNKTDPQEKYIMNDSFWEGELIQVGNDRFRFIPHKEVKIKLIKHYGTGDYHFKRFKEAGCSFYFEPTNLPEQYHFILNHDQKNGDVRYRIDIDMDKRNFTRDNWLSYIKEFVMQDKASIREKEITPVLDELERISNRMAELMADEYQRREEALRRLSAKRDYKQNTERGQTIVNDIPATFEEYLCYSFINYGFDNVDFDKDFSDLRFIVFGNGKCILTTDDDSFQAVQFFTSSETLS